MNKSTVLSLILGSALLFTSYIVYVDFLHELNSPFPRGPAVWSSQAQAVEFADLQQSAGPEVPLETLGRLPWRKILDSSSKPSFGQGQKLGRHLLQEENQKIQLPLTLDSPPRQLPLMYVLPSYPTSGSILARRLYEEATRTSAASFYQEVENPSLFFNFPAPQNPTHHVGPLGRHRPGRQQKSIFVNPQKTLPLGLPTLVKTHFDNPAKIGAEAFEQQLIRGVVLLVRNPGDTVLHNSVRWSHCPARISRHERQTCYLDKAALACPSIARNAASWLSFYSTWLNFCEVNNVPLFILHYENLVLQPNVALSNLLEFMGAEFAKPVSAEPEKSRENMGAELSSYCRAPDIQRFVSAVLDVASKMGYTWDEGQSKFIWSDSMRYPLSRV